jgi:hypothetical protein
LRLRPRGRWRIGIRQLPGHCEKRPDCGGSRTSASGRFTSFPFRALRDPKQECGGVSKRTRTVPSGRDRTSHPARRKECSRPHGRHPRRLGGQEPGELSQGCRLRDNPVDYHGGVTFPRSIDRPNGRPSAIPPLSNLSLSARIPCVVRRDREFVGPGDPQDRCGVSPHWSAPSKRSHELLLQGRVAADANVGT